MGPVLRKRTPTRYYVEEEYIVEVKPSRKAKNKTVQAKSKRIKQKKSTGKTSPTTKAAQENKAVGFLTAADVLLGRGKGSYLAQGNLRLQQLVGFHLPTYIEASDNKEKINITNQIVAQIKQGGGRFLNEDSKGNLVEIPDGKARIKVGQAMRHRRRMMEEEKKQHGSERTNTGIQNDPAYTESGNDSETSVSAASHHEPEEESREDESTGKDCPQPVVQTLNTEDTASSRTGASYGGEEMDFSGAQPAESGSTFLTFAKATLASLNLNHNIDAFIHDDDISEYTTPDFHNCVGPDEFGFGIEFTNHPLDPEDDLQQMLHHSFQSFQ